MKQTDMKLDELDLELKKLRQKNGVFDSFEEWFETQTVNYEFDDSKFNEGVKDLLEKGWNARNNEVDGHKQKFKNLCASLGVEEIADGVVTLDFWKSERGIVFKTLFKVIVMFIILAILIQLGVI